MKKIGFDKGFFLFLAICITLASCSIQADNKGKRTVGRWLSINVLDPAADSLQEHWVFDDNGSCSIIVIGADTTVADVGDWTIIQKLDKAFVSTIFEGKYAASFDYSNEWRIKKLNKKVLFITFENGGLRTKEFEKL